jgi:hypothetical protein
MDVFANLDRKLPSGTKDEHLGRVILEVDLLEGRQNEGRGFSGSRLGETDDVFALERRWNGEGLDRGRFLISE